MLEDGANLETFTFYYGATLPDLYLDNLRNICVKLLVYYVSYA